MKQPGPPQGPSSARVRLAPRFARSTLPSQAANRLPGSGRLLGALRSLPASAPMRISLNSQVSDGPPSSSTLIHQHFSWRAQPPSSAPDASRASVPACSAVLNTVCGPRAVSPAADVSRAHGGTWSGNRRRFSVITLGTVPASCDGPEDLGGCGAGDGTGQLSTLILHVAQTDRGSP